MCLEVQTLIENLCIFSTYLISYIINYFHLRKIFFEEYAYNRPSGLKFAGFVLCVFIYLFIIYLSIHSLITQEHKLMLIGRSVALSEII